MNLQKLILTKNDAYTEANKIIPCGILWHSTGANNADLKRYVGPDDGKLGVNTNNNHWNKPGFRKCGHAMIGKLKDGSIATYQTLPWDYRCMLSGKPSAKDDVKPDPRGSANVLGYIQFEICEDSIGNSVANKEYAMAVYKEAVEFSAYICKMFNFDPLGKNRWGLPVTLDHASAYKLGLASNHGDVLHWFGKHGITLAKIRQDIADEMGQQPTPEPEPEPGELPYKVRLEKGTPYYEKPDKTSKITGAIEITTNYTIVEESGVYGKLKSGAGWVQLMEPCVPDIDPEPEFKTYTIYLAKGTPYYVSANKNKKAGQITVATNYTIVAEEKGFGRFKSGAGWVDLGKTPEPEPIPPTAPKAPTAVLNWARENLLRQNDRSSVVGAAQVALIMRSYDVGNLDEVFGPKTLSAVKALQKQHGFGQDGIIGAESWPILLGLSSRTVSTTPQAVKTWILKNKLAQYHRGALVGVVQAALVLRGYDVGGIDNVFGPKTLTAVKAFQKANGFAQDGVVGVDSWPALLG